MSEKIQCPICNGLGHLKKPINICEKKFAVKVLFKNGFGVRQIQRLLGYKSPRSVSVIIQTDIKKIVG